MSRPTIRVDHVGPLHRAAADGKGTEPVPGIDGQVVYEIRHPDGRFSYMAQPFARGPGHTQVDGRNVWAWDGSWEAPTLTPSFLCIDEDPLLDGNREHALRVHLFLKAGCIELCSDSNVDVAA